MNERQAQRQVNGLWSNAAGERKSAGRLSHVDCECVQMLQRWSRSYGGPNALRTMMCGRATADVLVMLLGWKLRDGQGDRVPAQLRQGHVVRCASHGLPMSRTPCMHEQTHCKSRGRFLLRNTIRYTHFPHMQLHGSSYCGCGCTRRATIHVRLESTSELQYSMLLM